MARTLVLISLTLLALLGVSLPTASALLIQVDFAGTTDSAAQGPAFDASLPAGTPFQGYVIYDDAQAPQSSTPTLNTYLFAVPPWTLHVELGNYVVDAGAAGVQIQIANTLSSDGFSADATAVFTAGTVGGGALLSSALSFLVADGDGSTLPSTNLADLPLGPTVWPFSNLSISLFHDDFSFSSVQGTVYSFEASVVPEPTTLALLALGCAALAAQRKRGAQ